MCECITSKNNLILICSKALNAEVVAPFTIVVFICECILYLYFFLKELSECIYQ